MFSTKKMPKIIEDIPHNPSLSLSQSTKQKNSSTYLLNIENRM